MTAIEDLLEEKNWIVSNMDGATQWCGIDGARLDDARSEYASLLARIEELDGENNAFIDKVSFRDTQLAELKNDNEAMRRVVEAAQKWCEDFEAGAETNLVDAIEEYNLSQ